MDRVHLGIQEWILYRPNLWPIPLLQSLKHLSSQIRFKTAHKNSLKSSKWSLQMAFSPVLSIGNTIATQQLPPAPNQILSIHLPISASLKIKGQTTKIILKINWSWISVKADYTYCTWFFSHCHFFFSMIGRLRLSLLLMFLIIFERFGLNISLSKFSSHKYSHLQTEYSPHSISNFHP